MLVKWFEEIFIADQDILFPGRLPHVLYKTKD
jgi:hypothetical protein